MGGDRKELSAETRSRMEYLAGLLNEASEAYYARDTEIMSNLEYDRYYDELQALEKESGFVLSGSPTLRVGYAAVDELPRVRHEQPMLSLDKTKSREALAQWLGDQTGLLSWKLDGLTVVLTYEGGKLARAVTRGNGEIGEEITANAAAFRNLPAVIPFKGKLTLRGEAVIRYSDFAVINEEIAAEAAAKGTLEDVRYKNPRNLCSGSVRQLDSSVTAKRRVRFYAFTLVEASVVSSFGQSVPDFHNSRLAQLRFLQDQGFETVETSVVTGETIADQVDLFEQKIAGFDIPSDGLVLLMDDIAYGDSLGRTAKFPRNAIAFKWADEQQETQCQHCARPAAGDRRQADRLQGQHDHSPDRGESDQVRDPGDPGGLSGVRGKNGDPPGDRYRGPCMYESGMSSQKDQGLYPFRQPQRHEYRRSVRDDPGKIHR